MWKHYNIFKKKPGCAKGFFFIVLHNLQFLLSARLGCYVKFIFFYNNHCSEFTSVPFKRMYRMEYVKFMKLCHRLWPLCARKKFIEGETFVVRGRHVEKLEVEEKKGAQISRMNILIL